MKILVINTGSSSIKYQMFDMARETVLSQGLAEKIGEEDGILHHAKFLPDGVAREHEIHAPIPDHRAGLDRIISLLADPEWGVIKDKGEIEAVGHRVVHGGELFHAPVIVDAEVVDAVKANIPLAPLHNPANLTGIEVATVNLPEAVQVAVFDTAFHQTLRPEAYMYALPMDLYTKEKVRRYGFHGTSHEYVANRAAEFLEKPLADLKLITVHLGNGASMTAIDGGAAVDTSMGMTPLEGLIMGTRAGDLDPALPFFLADHMGMTLAEIDRLLNKNSGLKGICGTNDMREVIDLMEGGDAAAKLAFDMYAYRIKKYVGAYYAALGGLDALVFTAGVGENSSAVRKASLAGLDGLGIVVDEEKNMLRGKAVRTIAAKRSKVEILVVPTNEELKIARETRRVLQQDK